MPETNHGWEVLVLVDADNHLNIYITNTYSSDIYECDTGQGDRGSGEELAKPLMFGWSDRPGLPAVAASVLSTAAVDMLTSRVRKMPLMQIIAMVMPAEGQPRIRIINHLLSGSHSFRTPLRRTKAGKIEDWCQNQSDRPVDS